MICEYIGYNVNSIDQGISHEILWQKIIIIIFKRVFTSILVFRTRVFNHDRDFRNWHDLYIDRQ